jgi:hypothetical protein
MKIPYVIQDPALPRRLLHGLFWTEGIDDTFDGLDPWDMHSDGMTEVLYHLNSDSLTDNNWILLHSDTANDAQVVHEVISDDRAREWLEKNDHAAAVEKYFTKPKGGRPSIGPKIQSNVTPSVYSKIQRDREDWGLSESDVVRSRLEIAYMDTVDQRQKRMFQLALAAEQRKGQRS